MLGADRKPLLEEAAAASWSAQEPDGLVACDLVEPPPDERPVPAAPPQPCPTCGCPFWWEDLAGNVHCCACVAIPSRRMAVEAWFVFWRRTGPGRDEGEAYWGPWEFKVWNPFGHLPAPGEVAGASEFDSQDF